MTPLGTLLPMPTRPKPADYLAKRDRFAEGQFKPGTPPEVYLAAGLASRLEQNIGDESIRYTARKAGLSAQTVLNILNGTTWPDLRTIAKLEIALNRKLWGNEHRKTRR